MTPMTPKTQSVCKQVNSKYGVCGLPENDSIHHNDIYEYFHTFEPVAEPASTGEPQSCPCPCHKGESVICNCGGGFECEYINSIPAARPSEPSACNWPFEGCCTKKEACIQANRCLKNLPTAPQTSAELQVEFPWCELCGDSMTDANYHGIGKCVSHAAAPQPVSGDAPDSATFGSVTCSNTAEPLIEPDQPSPMIFASKLAGDAPKVEDIARKLHLYHCQERRSGSICPCHVVAEGMSEGCHCKEETADIAAIMRRYFPPASQTHDYESCASVNCPQCSALTELAEEILRHTGGQPEAREFVAMLISKKLATPASTARTDGWVSVESKPTEQQIAAHKGWFHVANESTKRQDIAKYLKGDFMGHALQFNEVTHWRELPAAPGSVPPLKCQITGCNNKVAEMRHCVEHLPGNFPPDVAGAAQPGDDKPEGK